MGTYIPCRKLTNFAAVGLKASYHALEVACVANIGLELGSMHSGKLSVTVAVSAYLLAKRPQAEDGGNLRRRRPSNPPHLLRVDHPRIGPACDGCTDVGWETPVN